MIFDFFSKFGSKKEKNELNEYIYIIDDNGNQKKVSKQKWLDNELYPYLEKNKTNVSMQCDALKAALEYGVLVEIVQICLKLYNENKNNKKCASLLFECYVKNKMFNEAVKVYEEFQDFGNKLDEIMYYDLAQAYEELKKFDDMEKSLFLAFSINNNYIKAIDRLKIYIKEQGEEYYYNWLKNLANNSHSWYLYLNLSELEFERHNETEGAINAVKSLLEMPNNEKHLLKIANILKIKKRFKEYEDYIIPRYNENTLDYDLHNSILDFYFQDKQYEKGLELLKRLYSLNKYHKNFVVYERAYLMLKLKKEKPIRYENIVKNKGVGKDKNIIITGPVYNMLFKDKLEAKTGDSVLILPFVIKSNNIIPDKMKDLTKTLHVFLNEQIFLNTSLNNKAFLQYDEAGLKLFTTTYPIKYFEMIKNANPNLDYVLTGEVIADDKGAFELCIYTYDLNENIRIDKYKKPINPDSFYQVANQILNSFLGYMTEVSKINEIKDKDFIRYYSDYMEILLGIHSYNKYRIYETDDIINYCLKNSNENKMKMLLSLLYIQSKHIEGIKEMYKQDIYNIIVSSNFNDGIKNKFHMVYGVNNEKK